MDESEPILACACSLFAIPTLEVRAWGVLWTALIIPCELNPTRRATSANTARHQGKREPGQRLTFMSTGYEGVREEGGDAGSLYSVWVGVERVGPKR